jgi:Bax protein
MVTRGAIGPAMLACGLVIGLSMVCAGATASGGNAPEMGTAHRTGLDPDGPPRLNLLTFTPASAEQLVRVLTAVWDAPRGLHTIPNIAPDRFPEGMDALPLPVKKRAFLRSIAPHVVAANLWIAYERDYLLGTLACRCDLNRLDPPQRACLVGLANRYRVAVSDEGALLPPDRLETLRQRVDVVPPGLALAQAAIESGWGASRFVRLGNSLFGQWVFSSTKGMAPRNRSPRSDYAVAAFDDLGQSVGAYLYNLNTFWAYEDLRRVRRNMRRSGERLDSKRLAEGLRLYSERRDAYVRDIQTVMRANDLEQYGEAVFTQVAAEDWLALLDGKDGTVSFRRAGLIAPIADSAFTWFPADEGPTVPGSDE